MKISRRIVPIIMMILMCFTLTGCDINPDDYFDGFTSDMQHRAADNKTQVDRLQQAGLLSKEAADSLKKAIDGQEKKMDAFDSVADASFYVRKELGSPLDANNSSGKNSMSIVSEDDNAIKELLENLDYNVYVLKTDPLNKGGEENALATIDIISTEVEKAKKGEASNLSSYFVDSGRKVWDISKPENQIIKKTNAASFDGLLTSSINTMGTDYVGVKTIKNDDGTVEQEYSASFVIKEFNIDAINRLVGADGVNKDIYVIVGNKCYLMQYPVQIVKGFKQEENKFNAVYSESDMSVNLLTKKIMDKDGRVCTTTAGDIYHATGEGGFNELGNASFVVDGMPGPMTKFGFAKKDNDGKEIEPSEELLKKVGRIVLRDYMELNYMPTVVDNEDFVALGRKVRLTKFKGTGNEQIGLFVDKSGNEIQNSMRISINDIMGIVAGESGTKDKLNLKSESNAQVPDGDQSDGAAEPPDSQEPDDATNTFEIGASQDRILTPNYVEELEATTRFPGPLVATTDDLKLGTLESKTEGETEGEDNSEQTSEEAVNNTGEEQIKHFMYGMAVDIDPFQSNLFSGWIEITGDNGDIGSLDWWNNWLNESTYRYRIDRDAVINFLSGNYMYEMRENGNIILDLDTITNIQQQYNKEDKVASANFIITLFAVLGFILIAYSTLVLAAWVYDTNIIAGPRMMGVLSFGRWEAISDSDELPYMDTQSKHYMTFSKTLKACIVLIGVGILIIFVNILSIVDFFVLLFGQIAEVLGSVIQGMS